MTMVEIGSRPLIVVCAGAQASEVASYLRNQQIVGEPVSIRGFVDDHRFEPTFEGAPLLGGIDQLSELLRAQASEGFLYLAAVGDTRTRAAVVRRVEHLEATNLTRWTARHVSAVIGDTVQIGSGSRIGPGAIVTARSTIGDHCVLNANCTVSHDVELASFVNIGPGASICGGVRIDEGCAIGAGATIADGIHVGAWSVIGAGAVVTDDVPAHVTVAGVPARIVQRHGRGLRHTTLVS
jgi:sugar O-acyltransferase (sialic acid O-acetyltransferase NeuD family)